MAIQTWQTSYLNPSPLTTPFPEARVSSILVVDDNDFVRTTLAAVLSDAGYEVGCAPDGFAALEMIARRQPKLVISDVNMPGMSGFELFSILSERFPGIRRIAMSGALSSSDVPQGRADAFVEKGKGQTGHWLQLVSSLIGEGVQEDERPSAPKGGLDSQSNQKQVKGFLSASTQGLRYSDQSPSAGLDSLPVRIMIMSSGLGAEYANVCSLEFIGMTFDAIEGYGWTAILHPEEIEQVWRRASTEAFIGRPFQIDCRVQRFDGQYRYTRILAEPFKEGNPDGNRWFFLFTDTADSALPACNATMPEVFRTTYPASHRNSELGSGESEFGLAVIEEVLQPLTAIVINAKAAQLNLRDESPDLFKVLRVVDAIERSGRDVVTIIREIRVLRAPSHGRAARHELVPFEGSSSPKNDNEVSDCGFRSSDTPGSARLPNAHSFGVRAGAFLGWAAWTASSLLIWAYYTFS